MIEILVVEDDKNLNELICSSLRKNGYQTYSAYDGEEGYEVFEQKNISLILSDIMMPKRDGFQFAAKVRETDKAIPILFLSAREDKFSKQIGYQIGIDDYMVKPFDMDELMMKVKAVLRRVHIETSKVLTIQNLTMNEEEYMAYVNEEALNLTVREFNILYMLLSFPKKTFTRSMLMEKFWDYDSSTTSRTVDVYMAKIREKTSACTGFEIQTVHGLGYKAVLK